MKSDQSDKTKIVYLNGGMGNQLFQYAFGLFLEKVYGYRVTFSRAFLELHLPGVTKREFLLNSFDRTQGLQKKPQFLNYGTFFLALLKKKLSAKFSLSTNTLWESSKKKLSKEQAQNFKHLIGYWQNHEYLEQIGEELRRELTISKDPNPEFTNYKDKISNNLNSVSVHIRRGDYITNAQSSKLYKICDIDYYRLAAEIFKKDLKDPQFFVFSDDLSWCRENLNFLEKAEFVSLPRISPFAEIYLQSLCHHNIIANSTFSWWGAWLNRHKDKKVIVPKQWFHTQEADHLLLKEWIVL